MWKLQPNSGEYLAKFSHDKSNQKLNVYFIILVVFCVLLTYVFAQLNIDQIIKVNRNGWYSSFANQSRLSYQWWWFCIIKSYKIKQKCCYYIKSKKIDTKGIPMVQNWLRNKRSTKCLIFKNIWTTKTLKILTLKRSARLDIQKLRE